MFNREIESSARGELRSLLKKVLSFDAETTDQKTKLANDSGLWLVGWLVLVFFRNKGEITSDQLTYLPPKKVTAWDHLFQRIASN